MSTNTTIMSLPQVNIPATNDIISKLSDDLKMCTEKEAVFKDNELNIKKQYDSIWSEEIAKTYNIEYINRSDEEKNAAGWELRKQLQTAAIPLSQQRFKIHRLKRLITYNKRLVAIATDPASLFVFNEGYNWLGFDERGLTRDGRHQSIFGNDGYDIYDDNNLDAFNIDIYGYKRDLRTGNIIFS
jgi:hypothetical protein